MVYNTKPAACFLLCKRCVAFKGISLFPPPVLYFPYSFHLQCRRCYIFYSPIYIWTEWLLMLFFFIVLGKPMFGLFYLMNSRVCLFWISTWNFYLHVRKKMFWLCVETSSRKEPCLLVLWFALLLQDVSFLLAIPVLVQLLHIWSIPFSLLLQIFNFSLALY